MKKRFILLVLAGIAIGYSSCTKEKVTDVTLNKNEVFLVIGKTETLIATVQPDDVSNKKVTWKSSNPSVATVSDNGLVTAIKDGNAIITVTTKNGKKTATCFVSVDYRNKWVGEYVGEYISYWSNPINGSGSRTSIAEANISIWQDSCLFIKVNIHGEKFYTEEFYPKVNTDGYFKENKNSVIPICEGNILNDDISFKGLYSFGISNYSGYEFKGKKQ